MKICQWQQLAFATLLVSWLCGCASFSADTSDSHLPMYGGKRKPAPQEDPDGYNEYRRYYDRDSRKAAAVGWEYIFQKHDASGAMEYFNAAWWRNPENCESYWGMGIASGMMAEHSENPRNLMKQAVELLEKALSLAPDNDRIKLDLVNAYTGYAIAPPEDNAKKDIFLSKAETLCRGVIARNHDIGRAYYLLAANLFYQGRYKESQAASDNSAKNGFDVPSNFQNDLKQHLK